MMFNQFKKLECSEPLEPCPACGSPAELWQFSETKDDIVSRFACCSRTFPIGPLEDGCPLSSSPKIKQATARQAISVWNESAKALSANRDAATVKCGMCGEPLNNSFHRGKHCLPDPPDHPQPDRSDRRPSTMKR
jgi:hypothetical protein